MMEGTVALLCQHVLIFFIWLIKLGKFGYWKFSIWYVWIRLEESEPTVTMLELVQNWKGKTTFIRS
jgi:hypothetical protein